MKIADVMGAVRLLLRWLAVVLWFVVANVATAQDVRDEGVASASEWKWAHQAADESPVRHWLTLLPDDPTGTQIRVSGDFYNSDVTIETLKTFGHAHLLTVCQAMAKAVGRPSTDFILR